MAPACDQFQFVEPSKDIYFLVDVSKSYQEYSVRSLVRLRGVIDALQSNDRVTIAKIQSCSYSDEAILLPTRTLSPQETQANAEKMQLADEIDKLASSLEQTDHTDIKGALILASQHFNRSKSHNKLLVIFSDLQDAPKPGCARQSDELLNFGGAIVVFADVSISKPDEANAAGRMTRINLWRDLVLAHGASKVELVNGVYEIESVINAMSGS